MIRCNLAQTLPRRRARRTSPPRPCTTTPIKHSRRNPQFAPLVAASLTALAVTSYCRGGYIGPAYASLQNPSNTDTYLGDPTINLYSYGEIAQIQGEASSNTVMDNQSCGELDEWDPGDPAAGYSWTLSATLDSAQSSQASTEQETYDVIAIEPGEMWCFSGSIAAHDDGQPKTPPTPPGPPSSGC